MSADAQNSAPAGQAVAAPGQNGSGTSSHMPPPPLPPVIIPQNTNPIPTAITSPMSVSGVTSPTSGGGFVRRAAPEPNKRALYVGGLDPRVTEDILKQIFETTGHVQSVKIIPDKNVCISCVITMLLHLVAVYSIYMSNRPRVTTTDLWSTMTPVQLIVPCKP